MLRGLIGNCHAVPLAQLTCPHPRAVHDDIRFDGLARDQPHAGHFRQGTSFVGSRRRAVDCHPLQYSDAVHPGALGECHRCVSGIGPSVVLDVESRQHIGHVHRRTSILHLLRRYFNHVHPAMPIERRHPPVVLQPIPIGGQLYKSDGQEAAVHPRLLRQYIRVQIAGVPSHGRRRHRERTERVDQAGGVPRRSAR